MNMSGILAQNSATNVIKLNNQGSSQTPGTAKDFSNFISTYLRTGSTNLLAIAEGARGNELEFLNKKEDNSSFEGKPRTPDDVLGDLKELLRALTGEND